MKIIIRFCTLFGQLLNYSIFFEVFGMGAIILLIVDASLTIPGVLIALHLTA